VIFSVWKGFSSVQQQETIDHDLKIRISGLSSGIHEYAFRILPSDIGLDEHFQNPLEVQAHLDKSSHQLLLRAEIHAVGHFECDRCLDQFDQPLSSDYRLVYVFDETAGSRYPEEEVQILREDTVSIDLSEDVRQMVLLSVPLKLLCSEECRGLCPTCGTNLNHAACTCRRDQNDPRWNGLKDLLK